MALSFLNFSLTAAILVLFFACPNFARPSMKAAGGNSLLGDICHMAENPTFCWRTLGSDPRSRTADTKGLCQITIELALSNATSTRTKIQLLSQGARDHGQKVCYATCANLYLAAVRDLQDAKNLLNSGDYNGVNIAASGAYDNASNCENVCNRSPLSIDNNSLDLLCEMIDVISNLLSKPR